MNPGRPKPICPVCYERIVGYESCHCVECIQKGCVWTLLCSCGFAFNPPGCDTIYDVIGRLPRRQPIHHVIYSVSEN